MISQKLQGFVLFLHSQTPSVRFDVVDFFTMLLTSSTWCIAQNRAASGIPARSGLVGTDNALLWSGFCDHSSLGVALRPSNRYSGDQKTDCAAATGRLHLCIALFLSSSNTSMVMPSSLCTICYGWRVGFVYAHPW